MRTFITKPIIGLTIVLMVFGSPTLLTAASDDSSRTTFANEASPDQITVEKTPHGMEDYRVTFALEDAKAGEDQVIYREIGIAGMETQRTGDDLIENLASAGCGTITGTRTKYTALGQVAFRWVQQKYFCWSYGVVSDVNVSSYITDNNGFNQYRGLVNDTEYFFHHQGEPEGGHYSMRQAHVENCIVDVGCVYTWYPWVTISVYGDGGFMAMEALRQTLAADGIADCEGSCRGLDNCPHV